MKKPYVLQWEKIPMYSYGRHTHRNLIRSLGWLGLESCGLVYARLECLFYRMYILVCAKNVRKYVNSKSTDRHTDRQTDRHGKTIGSPVDL